MGIGGGMGGGGRLASCGGKGGSGCPPLPLPLIPARILCVNAGGSIIGGGGSGGGGSTGGGGPKGVPLPDASLAGPRLPSAGCMNLQVPPHVQLPRRKNLQIPTSSGFTPLRKPYGVELPLLPGNVWNMLLRWDFLVCLFCLRNQATLHTNNRLMTVLCKRFQKKISKKYYFKAVWVDLITPLLWKQLTI